MGPFSEATDCHVGQEQGGGAAGGQEQLQGVKFKVGYAEHATDLVLVSKPMSFYM